MGAGSDHGLLIMASTLTRAVLAALYSAILVAFADQIALLLLGSTSNVRFLYLAAIGVVATGFTSTFYNALIGLNRMLAVRLSYVFSALAGWSVGVLLVIEG